MTGVIFDELVGFDVASGDLNDDGLPDLILGAPRPPLNGEDPGSVYVFFSPVSGQLLASDADVVVTGEQDNDEFGTAVASADLDGDGAADLAASALQTFVPNGEGKAYVLYGPLAGAIPAADADAILLGEVLDPDDGLFGDSLAAVDTNRDGKDELAVGAPFFGGHGIRSGRVYVFNGPLSGTLPAAGADRIVTGGAEFDLFGTAVAAAGDNEGDGFGDFLVGAPGFFGDGGVYAALYSGASLFADGFESGDTSAWAQVVAN